MLEAIKNNNKAMNLITIIKVLLIVFTGIFLFFIIRSLYLTFFKSKADILGEQENTNKLQIYAVDSDIKTELKKGLKASYKESAYMDLADQLYSNFGLVDKADYEDIRPILQKLHSNVDVLMLTKAYGLRKFGTGFNTPKSLSLSFQDCADYNSSAYWRMLVATFGKNR